MNITTPPPTITDRDETVGYILVPFFIITAIGVAVVVVRSWLVWLKQNMMSRMCTVCVIFFLCFRSCICARKGGKLCSQFLWIVLYNELLCFLISVFFLSLRVDRLRHQLVPIYSYDPSEELHEAEQEMLWREEDTRV